jgi:hypothetical protein
MTSSQTDRIGGINSSAAIKVPVLAATTGPLTLSGLQSVDGVALAAGNRVLVKSQTDATQNGIYLAATGTWQRDADFANNNAVTQGTVVLVVAGTANGGVWFELTTANPISIGSSDLDFQQTFNPSISAAMSPVLGASTLAAAQTAMGLGSAATASLSALAQLASSAPFTAAQILKSTTAGSAVETFITLLRNKGAGVNSDFLEQLAFDGMNGSTAEKTFAALAAQIITATAGSEAGALLLRTIVAGALTTIMTLQSGVQVGSPTGGDKGAGTLNATGFFINGAALALHNTAVLTYQLASGSGGSALGASAWTLGTLNTKVTDPAGIILSFSGSQFVLPAGTFEMVAAISAGGSGSQSLVSRLRNTTGSSTLLVGTQGSGVGGLGNAQSMLIGRFTVAASQTLEIDLWTGSGTANQGLAASTGEVEMYKTVMITQVG